MNSEILIRNARTHNLKGMDLAIPRNQLVVITGRSGSGKSSLAIDTLFAEGQRQFVESLSLYSRQYFKQLPKPDVDSIEGLPPTVCLDQKRSTGNRRSTVGTATEIYDYLRLLMARAGVMHCTECNHPIIQHSCQQIVRHAMQLPEGTRLMVLAPLAHGQISDPASFIDRVRRDRLVRVRVDGSLFDIEHVPPIDPTTDHTIDAVVDRIIVRPGGGQRLLEAVEIAVQLASGKVVLSWQDSAQTGIAAKNSSSDTETWKDQIFSTQYQCPQCDCECEEVQPKLFSFNHPQGACPGCEGLGEVARTPVVQSTVASRKSQVQPPKEDPSSDEEGFDQTEMTTCQQCAGSRLSVAARSVRLADKNLVELVNLPIDNLIDFFQTIKIPVDQQEVVQRLAAEILIRLHFLQQVGVGYLSLGRGVRTLSGGEHQRVRLSTAIGSGLAQIGYILDEPTIGLHPRDNGRLLAAIRKLQNQNNTVVMVEHDEAVIREADLVVDIGPQAGEGGGQVVAVGTVSQIIDCPQSLTGDYLAGRRRVTRTGFPRSINPQRQIELIGARGRNLKNIDVTFPLDCLVLVTGVSGSGKSTLVNQTLVPAVKHSLQQCFERQTSLGQAVDSNRPALSGWYSRLIGAEKIDRLIVVDQSPPGHSQRSCPATVIDIFDTLRRVMAATKKAKQLGFTSSRFSFNSKSGWCPDCRGLGVTRVNMQIVPDIFVECETCRGRRYNLQTLQVKFNDHSIADILNMSIDRASEFLDGFEEIVRPLRLLSEIGLGYLRLGQSAGTLSGGESQRLKLAAELAKPEKQNTLYVLDEPTTGLHFEDLRLLMQTLDRLIEKGNSMIMIEHNLDVIRAADWVIDIGPEGGSHGGELVAWGSPDQIAANSKSITGRFLAQQNGLAD